jgi:hypothetical protein
MSNQRRSGHQGLSAALGAPVTWDELQREATERGVSIQHVRQERLLAQREREMAAVERMEALLRDPGVRRALRAGRMPTSADVTASAEPELEPEKPPSAGRIISPPRQR